MKILFSNPPWWDMTTPELRQGVRSGSRWPFTRPASHYPDSFNFGGYLPAPFFLQYAASYTAKAIPDAVVLLRDSIARGESYGRFYRMVKNERPDWIVLEVATPSWVHDREILQVLAHTCGAQVILCGTLDAEKVKEVLRDHVNVAAVVQGEPDKQIVKVINGARGVIAHDLLTKEEMNAAPFPAWDGDCFQNYWDPCPMGQQRPQLQVWASRGCPYRCCFCVWPAVMTGNDPTGAGTRAVRLYSVEYMEQFLTEAVAYAKSTGSPYRSIYLDDDTFNLVEKHTVAMCGVLRKIGLPWSAMCRADTLSRPAWKEMKDSGCFGVKLGFESGSQQVIDTIVNKKLNLKEAAETACHLMEMGMNVHGTFTIGLPGETAEQQQETRDFITELYDRKGINTHQLSGTAEIAGTPLATLRATGHLEKYPGAKIDANYKPNADGQKKVEGMAATPGKSKK